jgi:hypothetical protein
VSVLEACEWLEATGVGVYVRESLWGFPILVATHIMGLVLSVGTLVWFDLRLLGVSLQRAPVADVYRRLLPWMAVGMVVMFASGGVLFAGFATRAYGNAFFRIKLAAMLLAAVNALAFHLTTERGIARWNEAERPPRAARMAGLVSIAAWAVVIVAGRMMSYTMF